MKPFVFIIFIFITLGGSLFSQDFLLDTAFQGSKIYGITTPECISTWQSGDLAVSGTINHTIDKFTGFDYHYDSSFNTVPNTFAFNLVPVGDTMLLHYMFFYGFDPQGNEVMHDFRVEQQNEMYVSNNLNDTPPYFDRKTGYLYAACTGLNGTPCWGSIPDRFFYRLTPEGKLDTTFHHSMNRGISKIKGISENRILLTGTFSNYDGNIRKKLAFVNKEWDLLPEIMDPIINTLHYSTITTLITDSSGRSILKGDFYFSDSNQTYNLIRIDSLGNLDTTFHYWNFSDYNGNTTKSGIDFKDRIILSGFFTSVQGYERNGIVALYESGDIDTTLFKVGFTSVLNPVLGIPPYVYQFTSWENNLFCVGNFMSYENQPAIKLARFIYTENNETDDPETEENCMSTLYPNPATSTLTVCGKNGISYYLTDATGRKVSEGKIESNNHLIDLSAFKSGLYFLRLLTTDKYEIHRFIKL